MNYEYLVYALFGVCLASFLYQICKKVAYIEVIRLIAVAQWVFVPLLVHQAGLRLAIPMEKYMSYAFWGTLAFVVGISWPVKKRWAQFGRPAILKKIEAEVPNYPHLGLVLICIGSVSILFQPYIPTLFAGLTGLFQGFLVVGMFYSMGYRGLKRILLLGLGLSVIGFATVLIGMFGTLYFNLICFVLLFGMKLPRFPLIAKIAILGAGLFVMAGVQLAKAEYRMKTWKMHQNSFNRTKIRKDPALLKKLVQKNLGTPNNLLDERAVLGLGERFAQGLIVSKAMKNSPSTEPHGYGDITLKTSAVAFVPRIFWPSKPIMDPRLFTKKYAKIWLSKSNAVGLAPIGEAWADWGYYGILFMLFLGLVYRYCFVFFLKKAAVSATYLLWIPVICSWHINSLEGSVTTFFDSTFKLFILLLVAKTVLENAFRRHSSSEMSADGLLKTTPA